jgi:hypothetical protein
VNTHNFNTIKKNVKYLSKYLQKGKKAAAHQRAAWGI